MDRRPCNDPMRDYGSRTARRGHDLLRHYPIVDDERRKTSVAGETRSAVAMVLRSSRVDACIALTQASHGETDQLVEAPAT